MNGHLVHLHVSLLWVILLSAWMYKDFFAAPLSNNFRCTCRGRISGSRGNSIFIFFEEHIIPLSSVCIPFHIPNSAYVFQFLYLISHTSIFWVFFYFLFLVHSSPSCMMSYLTVVSLWISLMSSDVRHLFMCTLAICITSFEKKSIEILWPFLNSCLLECFHCWVLEVISMSSRCHVDDV